MARKSETTRTWAVDLASLRVRMPAGYDGGSPELDFGLERRPSGCAHCFGRDLKILPHRSPAALSAGRRVPFGLGRRLHFAVLRSRQGWRRLGFVSAPSASSPARRAPPVAMRCAVVVLPPRRSASRPVAARRSAGKSRQNVETGERPASVAELRSPSALKQAALRCRRLILSWGASSKHRLAPGPTEVVERAVARFAGAKIRDKLGQRLGPSVVSVRTGDTGVAPSFYCARHGPAMVSADRPHRGRRALHRQRPCGRGARRALDFRMVKPLRASAVGGRHEDSTTVLRCGQAAAIALVSGVRCC